MKAQHPEVSTTQQAALGAGGMGETPMKRSATAPALTAYRHIGSLDAAAAVRLPPRPIRALIDLSPAA